MKTTMMKKVTSICASLIALGLVGCAGETKVITETKYKVPQIFHPSPPPQVDALDVEWIVVNRDKLKELVAEAEQKGDKLPLLALTPQGYQNLSLTIQELKRYILQQREIILYYKNTYDDLKKNVDEANKTSDEDDNG